jgi:PKD repeat protein
MKRSLRWVLLLLMVGALAAVGGCKLFNADPVADFDWSPNEPLARSEVEFEDESTDEGGLFGGGGVVTWDWDFDDGDSASGQNPKHEFEKSGDYDVTLTVTDGGGKSSTVEKTVEISPSLDGTWVGNIVAPGGNTVSLRLTFNHSATGGIQGNAEMLQLQMPCDAISFNPTTGQIRFTLWDLLIRLDGTLDASETRIQGDWTDIPTGVVWWSWDVSLQ